MAKFKRNLITTALPYANGPVHIGHLAGVYVPADIYVRYLRQKGEEVVFIGGSDEHGVPITIKAQKEGVTPQDIVDRYHQIIKDSFEEFGISFDIYSRTSSKTHHELSSAFFKKLYDEGKFIEKTSMQFYDEKAGQFLADRYIVGKCPHCGNERAYGDQCEACGTSLNATDLIDPVSAITGNRRYRIDQIGSIQTGTTSLALIAISPFIPTMRTFPYNIAVGQKLSGFLIIELHRSFFDEFSFVI